MCLVETLITHMGVLVRFFHSSPVIYVTYCDARTASLYQWETIGRGRAGTRAARETVGFSEGDCTIMSTKNAQEVSQSKRLKPRVAYVRFHKL